MVEKELFGRLESGEAVSLYRITNNKGESVELLDRGAAIHSIRVRDRTGCLGDVVLGVERAEQLEQFHLEGVSVGRCAGRIAGARCEIDGKIFRLEPGRDGHCLHSGSGNYANRMFRGCVNEAENRVTFSLSDEGEGGFETPVDVKIHFSFDDRSALAIRYQLTPEGSTVLSPTNHAYFNLGCADARDHLLYINAGQYAVKGDAGVPDGRTAAVAGTPMDFREESRILDALSRAPEGDPLRTIGYDDNFLLEGSGLRHAARLRCRRSGRVMDVYTDMPSLVLFTFGAPREIPGKGGERYTGFRSVCLETQYPVNAVNCPGFPQPVFRAGEMLDSVTIYQFSLDGEQQEGTDECMN